MSKVLLVCPERLGPGLPAGVGIRFIEFARVLVADGHTVTMLSADGGEVPGCTSLVTSPETIRDCSAIAEVIVVQGHVANDLFAHGSIKPTVVDLYDPYLVENFHYFDEHGREVFDHDHATLMRSLLRADFFLCASESQRLFYLGLLAATRRLNPLSFESDHTMKSLIAIAPFGVPPQRVVPDKPTESPALLFGGIYDWYDPVLAIEAVAEARHQVPGLTLAFTRHPNADITPQSLAAKAERHVSEKGYSEFVTFEPWVPYAEREAFYDRFNAAILTFPTSLETDLAMRTRVLDYLWAGLPVITSPGRGTDELVQRYGAGAIVHEQSAEAFATSIRKALSSPDTLREMTAGASSFAADYQWAHTLQPLRDFCRTPSIDESKRDFVEGAQPGSPAETSISRRIRRRFGRRT